ncbi:hypothetical protein TNCV_1120641 [Trichonephila clavipes]|uniref:Uncharacterized protein n=1 Tax=Trichonephila clavipes TaxID=2585209 RepID=A0A8X6SZF7_TRICX|nr:hypothetical protein TNCV_1120641 [Trichonephila clavipes]
MIVFAKNLLVSEDLIISSLHTPTYGGTGTHRVIFNRHLRDSRPNDSVCKESTCFRGFDHFSLHTPTYGGIGEPIAGFDHFFPPYAYLRWHWGTHRVIFNRHLRDSRPNDSVCKESTCFRGFDHFFPPYAYLRWHWGTHRVIFNRHLRDSRPNDSVCKESTCFRGFDHFFPPYAYLRWHWGTHRVIFNRHLRDSRPNDSVCKESTCFRGFDHFFLHTPTYGGIGEPIA